MSDSLKSKTLKGTVWSTVERFSVQGIAFIVMIIMARILTPADYGLVGMIAIFIAVSQSLVDSGFSQALIRKQDRSETDNSTVFYFNVAVGLILYAILFLSAPAIARFYGEPLLVPVTRLVSFHPICRDAQRCVRSPFCIIRHHTRSKHDVIIYNFPENNRRQLALSLPRLVLRQNHPRTILQE